MGKAFLGPQLVEAGVLDVLASWLRPLPRDGALPAGGVKRAVVGGLARLGVDWSEGGALTALKKSGIGRLVLAMSKDKDMPETARMVRPTTRRKLFFSLLLKRKQKGREACGAVGTSGVQYYRRPQDDVRDRSAARPPARTRHAVRKIRPFIPAPARDSGCFMSFSFVVF
jgi:hypothetical protein